MPSKFSVEITDEQKSFLDQLPHGTRKLLFAAIIDSLMEACQHSKQPEMVIAGIVSKQINLKNFMRIPT